jgi:hypothetical protein
MPCEVLKYKITPKQSEVNKIRTTEQKSCSLISASSSRVHTQVRLGNENQLLAGTESAEVTQKRSLCPKRN